MKRIFVVKVTLEKVGFTLSKKVLTTLSPLRVEKVLKQISPNFEVRCSSIYAYKFSGNSEELLTLNKCKEWVKHVELTIYYEHPPVEVTYRNNLENGFDICFHS